MTTPDRHVDAAIRDRSLAERRDGMRTDEFLIADATALEDVLVDVVRHHRKFGRLGGELLASIEVYLLRRGRIEQETVVLEGEVIGDSEGVVSRPPPSRWKPAGEVGTITGAGTSVVEEPKNDARRVIKQVGPGR